VKQLLFSGPAFFSNIFHATPSPLFVVDDAVHNLHMNCAAQNLLAKPVRIPVTKRGGNALDCIHAIKKPEDCGRTPACTDCAIRTSVHEASSGGKVYRKNAVMSRARQR